MKKVLRIGVVAVVMLFIAACGGGGGDSRTIFVAQILSDQLADGDIAFDPVLRIFSVTNGPDTLFFGIDDLNLDLPEYRAFLDFPLDGFTGGGVVPLGAIIVSADIEVFVNDILFSSSVPTILELVPFSVTGLTSADFNRSALATRSPFSINVNPDLGHFVRIDVTSLMIEAQNQAFPSLQLRFLPNSLAPGLVVLDDAVAGRRPLLTVEYW